MQYIGMDLGSTNTKAAVYDEKFHCIAVVTASHAYRRSGSRVEFDLKQYRDTLAGLLRKLVEAPGVRPEKIERLTLTGQAETLVVLDKDGEPLMDAISWMDERSREECKELEEKFSKETYIARTGQLAVLPTWPATKIRWLQKNRPEIFERVGTYMLLKDYIVYWLTGQRAADCSIATFTFYFDIYRKCYWEEMLDAIGITKEQLPPLVEPCTLVGRLTKEAAALTGLSETVAVNRGTLDHFAGMIGTGNVTAGGLTLSVGTVMGLSVFAPPGWRWQEGAQEIAMHYGFLPDSYVMLPVAESGGVSLEWFRKTCMPGVSYPKLNEELEKRTFPGDLIFLPYLQGTNAPEMDGEVSGLFYGLRVEHDAYDMAAAVMEGVAFLLRKNCEALKEAGTKIRYIVATGGGSKSAVWCQMQADITGLLVVIPREKEAACFGAALTGAVEAGTFNSYQEAADSCVKMETRYEPRRIEKYERKYRQFCALYQAMVSVERMGREE